MSDKTIITLECSDPDIAAYLILFHSIYESKPTGSFSQLLHLLPGAIHFLRDLVHDFIYTERGVLSTEDTAERYLFQYDGLAKKIIEWFVKMKID